MGVIEVLSWGKWCVLVNGTEGPLWALCRRVEARGPFGRNFTGSLPLCKVRAKLVIEPSSERSVGASEIMRDRARQGLGRHLDLLLSSLGLGSCHCPFRSLEVSLRVYVSVDNDWRLLSFFSF